MIENELYNEKELQSLIKYYKDTNSCFLYDGGFCLNKIIDCVDCQFLNHNVVK
jgi:hypothetical protein